MAVPRVVTTGAPHAMASRTGMPKPSYRDGYATQTAPRYRRASSASLTSPNQRTPLLSTSTRPQPRAPTMRSSVSVRRTASTSRARFLRGSSVPTASTYSPCSAGPSSVNSSSTAFGTTWIFSSETPSNSTSSRRVNSETAITSRAARSTRGTTRGLYSRVHLLKAPGWRSTARSCTVTTSGTRGGRTGPR